MVQVSRQHPWLVASGIALGAAGAFMIDAEALLGAAIGVRDVFLDGFMAMLYAPFLCA